MNERQILLEAENQAGGSGSATSTELSTGLLTTGGGKGDTFLENTLVFNTDNSVDLTKREGEILRLIVSGQTNKEIAKRLSRSERTVEFHRNRLMRKMAAHNAAELVRQAIVMGIV